MGKLRAYGNALDAETATQFCEAVAEAFPVSDYPARPSVPPAREPGHRQRADTPSLPAVSPVHAELNSQKGQHDHA